jgi:hypothetical protein
VNNRKSILFFGVIALVFTGCAAVLPKPIPPVREKVVLRVLAEELSWAHLPLGAYKVPKSEVVVVTKNRSQFDKAGMAFGAAGAIAGLIGAHKEGKENAKDIIGEREVVLQFDLVGYTARILENKLKQGNSPPQWVIGERVEESHSLEIIPYVMLTVESSKRIQPYLFVKTRLLNRSRKQIWWTRYVYYIPEVRAIAGKSSWTENNGEMLKSAIYAALDKTINLMFMDARGETAWEHTPCELMVLPPGGFEFVQLRGEILSETDEVITFGVQMKGTYIGGVNIIPRSPINGQLP